MQPKQKTSKALFIYLGIILILLSFVFGYYYGVSFATERQNNTNSVNSIIDWLSSTLLKEETSFDVFRDVWQSIDTDYVYGPVDQQELVYGMISGLVDSIGDPNSMFLDPESAEIFNQEISGNFEGIGVEISIKNDKLTVVAPLANTPADHAGLRAGDHIAKIDGVNTEGIPLDIAVFLIRGEKDTEVVLTIIREDLPPQDFAITRDNIKMQSVDWQIKTTSQGKEVGYIEIFRFSDDTESLFTQAINEILIESPEGIILDLRDNAGGYVDASLAVASEFVEDDVIFIEEDASGQREEYYDDARSPKLADIKTVVLVNMGSASASEIVAGALSDNNLAELVGDITFGKGSVQDLEQYADGSMLKLTIGKWLTPSGSSIDEQGITPDYLVELTEEDYNNDRDPQLDKAYQLIDQV